VHNGHLFTCSADKTTRSFNIQASRFISLKRFLFQIMINCMCGCCCFDWLKSVVNQEKDASKKTLKIGSLMVLCFVFLTLDRTMR